MAMEIVNWKFVFLLSVILGSLFFASPGFNNISCGEINESGTYIVSTPIIASSGSSCINITIGNVSLDLNGSYIGGATIDSEAAIDVYNSSAPLSNITIFNGYVNNSYYGVYFSNVSNGNITNVTSIGISNYSFWIWRNSNNNVIAGCNSTGGTHGVVVTAYSGNNTVRNCVSNVSDTGFAVWFYSENNTLDNCTTHYGLYGLVLYSTIGNKINNSVSTNHTYEGIWVYDSNFSVIENSVSTNNTIYGIYLQDSYSNNISSCNLSLNYDDGIRLDRSHSNRFVSILSYRNGHEDETYAYNGFILADSDNNTFESSTAYNNSALGFYTFNSTNNTFHNSIVYNNSIGGFYFNASKFNNVSIANIYNNSNYGIYLHNSSNNSISYANASGCETGFELINSSQNNLSYNRAYNVSFFGFFLSYSNSNRIEYSNMTDAFFGGFWAQYSNSNTLISNIGIDNAISAFYLTYSNNTVFNSNTGIGSLLYGLYVYDSTGGNYSNNTLQNNTLYDLAITPTEDVFCNNIFDNNNGSGGKNISYYNSSINLANIHISELILCNADDSNITNATINGSDSLDNNGFLAFRVSNANISNLTSFENYMGTYFFESNISRFANNLFDGCPYGLYMEYSNLNFSANNSIYNTSSDGVDIYLDYNSNLSTLVYNVITNHLTFALNTTRDVSIQVVNLSNISSSDYTSITTLSGVSASLPRVVLSLQNNYYGLNVTNTTGSASFSPKLYYNNSDISYPPYNNSNIGLGKTSALGEWTYYSPTSTVAGESFSYNGLSISSFGYFAPVVYVPQTSSTSSSKSSKGTITLSYDFECKTGTVNVSAKEGSSELEDVEVILFGLSTYYNQKETTDSDGLALYTITNDGTYKLIATKDGYLTQTQTDISLELCKTTSTVTPETEPEVSEETTPPVTTEEPETTQTPSQEQLDADSAISDAESKIALAESEGKTVSAAKEALDDAKLAYAAGEYKSARQLAVYSVTLIMEPKSASEQEPETVAPVTETPKQDNTLMYLFGALVVIVVLVGAYFLFKGKGTGAGGYKGHNK